MFYSCLFVEIAIVNKESFKRFLELRITIQIQEPCLDRNLDHHQNLIAFPWTTTHLSIKILSKSVHNCLSDLADRQTDRQTQIIT